jgi:hypothetical protein
VDGENTGVNAPESGVANSGNAAQGEQVEGNEGGESGKAAEDKHKDSGAQKRINALTRQKYELMGRLDALEKQVQAGSASKGRDEVPSSAKAPNVNDFSDFQEYLAAMVDYRVEQGIAKTSQRSQQATQEATAAQHEAALNTFWQGNMASFADEVPDFEEVVSAADATVSPALMRAIKEADEGPRVLYYLAQNTKEVKALNSLSSFSAVVRQIGRLEERLEKAKSTKSKAPATPATVSGTGSAKTSSGPEDSMPVDQWMKLENERTRKKYGR